MLCIGILSMLIYMRCDVNLTDWTLKDLNVPFTDFYYQRVSIASASAGIAREGMSQRHT